MVPKSVYHQITNVVKRLVPQLSKYITINQVQKHFT